VSSGGWKNGLRHHDVRKPKAELGQPNNKVHLMNDNTRTSVLGNLIGSGEGGYYSFNRGVAGDSQGQELNPNITVGEIMRRQQLSYVGPDQLFAVGKYQMIGPHNGDPPDSVGTFKRAVDALGISPNEVFTPELQEKMFANYLITSKRPEINEYISGVTQGASGLEKAQVALAQEFASVGDPTNGGRSYYDNDRGGNAASIKPEDAANALNQMRERYAANKQNGLSDTAAYDALRDQPVSQQTVAQTASAQSRDYLMKGDIGERVEVLQKALNANGANLKVDGDFGEASKSAVENYQRANHLTVDGVAGREVLSKLGIAQEQKQTSATDTQSQAAASAALAGLSSLNKPDLSLSSIANDGVKGLAKPTEPARDIGADVAATAKDWAGRNFKPGESERCQDFVNTMLNTTSPGLADKIGTTRQAIDGLESGENLASRFFGKDVSKPVTDLSQAKPGDIVGFANTYGNYPPGTITHVGIYVGDGMIVDRPTSDRPVQLRSIDTFGEGNFVITRPNAYDQVQSIKTGVETQTQAPTTSQVQSSAPGIDTSLMRQGDSGQKVEELQRQLQSKGFDPGQLDGQFGPRTEAAVKAYQTAHGLEVDGVVGQMTRAQLTQPVQMASQATAPVAPDQAQLAAQAISQAARVSLNGVDGINNNPKPLVNDASHPDNVMFKDALKGVEKLPATMVSTQEQAEKMAASIVVAAKSANFGEIGGVVAHPNGGGVFAVDKKDFTDPAAKVVFVDAKQTDLPLKDSSQTLDQMSKQQTAQQGNEPKPELERRGMMVA
jgi:peptidoglycan hydrolase-like protein with peptidoglycan-binding domain